MKMKLFLIIFIIVGLCFSLFQIFTNDPSADISEREAREVATNLYGGKVIDYKEQNGNHQMTLENNTGTYYLVVDGKNKTVDDLKIIEQKTAPSSIEEAKVMIAEELNGQVVQIEEAAGNDRHLAMAMVEKGNKQYKVEFDLVGKKIVGTSEAPSTGEMNGGKGENTSGGNPEAIYEQKAKEIALQQAGGTVTNVEKVTTQKGVHYKVTIDGMKEVAHVYVQSDTGKVSSVSSIPKKQTDDDEHDDDDEDDDDDGQDEEIDDDD